jgi:excisionase family DNA binding protein
MNIKEAAEHLGISVKTLERKVAAGDVAVAYVPGATGKQRTFDAAELGRFKAAEAEKTVATTYVISKSRNSDAPSPDALQRAGNEQGTQTLSPRLADALHAALAARLAVPAPSLLLSIPDAAAWLGVSKHQVERAVADGRLRAPKIGRGRRVRPEDVLRLRDELFGKDEEAMNGEN